MPESPILDTLNKLMNGELHAAHIYLQAGAWCADRKMTGCQQFLLDHASEELMHMRKFLDYLIDIDLPAKFDALPEPKLDVDTPQELFKVILEHEKKVTANIHAATKQAHDLGDLSTFEFLQWYVFEQREEEKTFRDILDVAELIGEGPHSLYHFDREVAALAAKAASASGSAGGGAGQVA